MSSSAACPGAALREGAADASVVSTGCPATGSTPRRGSAGPKQLPHCLSALLDHVQMHALSVSSEKLASRMVRLLQCISPRIIDGADPQVLGIDLNIARCLCAEGIPDEVPALRATVWKVILGYLPEDPFCWDELLSSRRETYAGFVAELSEDLRRHEGRSEQAGSAERLGAGLGAEDVIEEVLDQINKDIFRTRPELDFFARKIDGGWEDPRFGGGRDLHAANVLEPLRHYDALARVLLLYGKLNPGVRYVQGMNELCAPLYYLFAQDPLNSADAEADTFFCFSLVMADMRDMFVKSLDDTENGMMGRIAQLNELLREKDHQVWQHLESLSVAPPHYSVRWLTLMLTQELEMPDVFRVWDALLSDRAKPHPLLHYVCVAMVCMVRDVLFAGDFADCLRTLQHYPPFAVDELLAFATKLRSADLVPCGFSNKDIRARPRDATVDGSAGGPGEGAGQPPTASGTSSSGVPRWLKGVARWLGPPSVSQASAAAPPLLAPQDGTDVFLLGF